jgi:hypothetical protein
MSVLTVSWNLGCFLADSTLSLQQLIILMIAALIKLARKQIQLFAKHNVAVIVLYEYIVLI